MWDKLPIFLFLPNGTDGDRDKGPVPLSPVSPLQNWRDGGDQGTGLVFPCNVKVFVFGTRDPSPCPPPGFLVNRILRAMAQEALLLLDGGVASAQDIDSAVVNALGHPMGPFRLMDLTGIDLSYYVSMEQYQQSLNPADRPSPTIVEKYVRGEWGRKSGKGFYEY